MLSATPDRDTDRHPCGAEQDVARVMEWYAGHARDLPWRQRECTPWGVLVSEVMLQQTQVARVEPRWRAWMERWPSPEALADAPVSEVLLAWQGMGYPRRALRLHEAATTIVARHAGQVPDSAEELLALPGIGDYTASAVLAFAFGQPTVVLDTNVRRVLARWTNGAAQPTTTAPSRAERALAASLLPEDRLAPTWSVAVMELGALICKARNPDCAACPLAESCAWLRLGRPAGAVRGKAQRFEGSDRQARGFLLRMVGQAESIAETELARMWEAERGGQPGSREQALRAIRSLVADGLLRNRDGHLWLP